MHSLSQFGKSGSVLPDPQWGNIKNVDAIDIDKYKDIKEETKRIKDYDYFENKLSGVATNEIDSEEVDSVAVVD